VTHITVAPIIGKLALLLSCSLGFLGLVACGDLTATADYNKLPTVTPFQSNASTNPVIVGTLMLGVPSPTSQDTPTLAPSNSALTPAAGATFQVNGTIQQIINDKGNIQIILEDNHFYLLKPDLAKDLADKLKVGVPITFTGQYDQAGLVSIIKVSQISHQAVSDVPANNNGGDAKDKGKDKNKNKDGNSDGNGGKQDH
jgi:hypothetical protein